MFKRLVSSTLKLDDIEVNNIHFWLADTLAAIIKNIQLMHMSVLQGTTVIHWILYFVSLVVGGMILDYYIDIIMVHYVSTYLS